MNTIVIVFIISAVLLGLLVGLKLAEFGRGNRYGESIRDRLDSWTDVVYVALFRTLPRKLHFGSDKVATGLAHAGSVTLWKGVHFTERRMRGVVSQVRGRRRELHRKQATSSFLEDVRQHKEAVNGDRSHGYYGE